MGNNDKQDNIDREDELAISLMEIEDEYLSPFLSDEFNAPKTESLKGSQQEITHAVCVDEKKLVSEFLSTPCSCGEDCGRLFSVTEVCEARENFRSMTWREQHSFIVGILQTFQRNAKQSASARSSRLRKRQKFDYFINADRPVCRTMFLFYHGETIDRLKRRQRHLVERGTTPLNHGNTGKIPKHACKDGDKNTVRLFIENFVAAHGLPDPGRDLRAEKGRLKVYLPTVMDYSYVHKIYEKSMVSQNTEAVKYQTFRRIWIDIFPNIVFSKPKSDLCITCEDNKKEINASIASGDEERKLNSLMVARDHILAAKKERDYYRDTIAQSKESFHKIMSNGKFCKNNNCKMHYSWDFAQQIHFPYEDHQVGPIYFKSPRIAQLFGVCCEAFPRQVNYLIDEADFHDKGADTVISLLDHYFDHYGLNEDHAFFTADNCIGQNKNNALIQYLMYRVLTGKHKSITLSFMLVGHTKFSPDGYFGLIKKKYRRSKVYTYDHLVDVINGSTNGQYNICQTYRDAQGKPSFQYRKWSAWLSKNFNKMPGITTYQHFYIEKNKPGVVCAKENSESENIEISLLKDDTIPFTGKFQQPCSLSPKGLSAERQWYLYEKIRSHIPDGPDQDATAPMPKVEKPK